MNTGNHRHFVRVWWASSSRLNSLVPLANLALDPSAARVAPGGACAPRSVCSNNFVGDFPSSDEMCASYAWSGPQSVRPAGCTVETVRGVMSQPLQRRNHVQPRMGDKSVSRPNEYSTTGDVKHSVRELVSRRLWAPHNVLCHL